MVLDLSVAAVVTLLGGTLALQQWSHSTTGGRDFLAMAAVLLSIAAGPIILGIRRRRAIIPISAVYCVVMFLALFVIDFLIGWHRGQVEL